ncbi:putative multidrug efflux pump outer membrane protein [Flavihumibacter petaseus NBRC 106054]|uniref:Putative multidrug efflux pump outer membrane protein n=2 Tax=Flavihumibacter TaxID=1004301 RepID=A0A0E9MUL6_9BACT|nr:putative multidrug efflux pump outer membrane protein [Flavihumibacter petaseus NBRC 106054]
MGTVAQAQDSTVNLNLQKAVSLSLQNSKIIKANMAKVDEATAGLKQARDNKLPDLSVTGGYMYLPVTPNIDMKMKSGSGSGSGSGESIEAHQAAYGLVNASLPLFAGGKIKYGIQSAQYLLEATRLDAENDREAIAQNAIEAFTNLYKAQQSVVIIQESLDQSRARDKDLLNMENNGLLARNDRLKAQLQTNNIELTLLDAQTNLKVAAVNMNLLLGLPEATVLNLVADTSKQPVTPQPIEQYEQLGLTNRKDVAALDNRKKAAEQQIRIANADKYPSLALTGGYIAADIPKVLSITNAVNVGVGLSYNVSSLWKSKAKVQQAEASDRQLMFRQAAMQDEIRREVNRAYQQYVVSIKKIDVYQLALEQAEENYKITKNKFDNSLVTTTDLLDANVSRIQSRINHAFAKAESLQAYSKLLETSGTLLSNGTINQ